jgi:hypothetical protein
MATVPLFFDILFFTFGADPTRPTSRLLGTAAPRPRFLGKQTNSCPTVFADDPDFVCCRGGPARTTSKRQHISGTGNLSPPPRVGSTFGPPMQTSWTPGRWGGSRPRLFPWDAAPRLGRASTPSTRHAVRNNFTKSLGGGGVGPPQHQRDGGRPPPPKNPHSPLGGGGGGPHETNLSLARQRPLVPGSWARRRPAAQGCLPRLPRFVCCRGPSLPLGTASAILLKITLWTPPNSDFLELLRTPCRVEGVDPVPGQADDQLPKGVCRGSRASFAVGVHPFHWARRPQ